MELTLADRMIPGQSQAKYMEAMATATENISATLVEMQKTIDLHTAELLELKRKKKRLKLLCVIIGALGGVIGANLPLIIKWITSIFS